MGKIVGRKNGSILTICPCCGIEFSSFISDDKRYCSRECFKEHFKPGDINRGKKFSPEHCAKMSASLKGRPGFKNEKNPAWKGGVTTISQRLKDKFEYRQWRSDIFTRDDFTCQECGQHGGDLQAHHIKAWSKIMSENEILSVEDGLACEELWNINNGTTLCVDCHRLTNNFGIRAKD